MKKIVLGTLAAVAVAAPLAMSAAPANATVSVENGTGHVDKGDVQTALHWNNADFDKGTITFATSDGTYVANYHFVVNGEVRDDETVQTTSTSTIATPTLSSNGKQINGWDLRPGARTVAPPSTATHTDAGARSWMIAGAIAGADVSQSTSTSHYVDGTDLTVTGTLNGVSKTVALPNTPVPVV